MKRNRFQRAVFWLLGLGRVIDGDDDGSVEVEVGGADDGWDGAGAEDALEMVKPAAIRTLPPLLRPEEGGQSPLRRWVDVSSWTPARSSLGPARRWVVEAAARGGRLDAAVAGGGECLEVTVRSRPAFRPPAVGKLAGACGCAERESLARFDDEGSADEMGIRVGCAVAPLPTRLAW